MSGDHRWSGLVFRSTPAQWSLATDTVPSVALHVSARFTFSSTEPVVESQIGDAEQRSAKVNIMQTLVPKVVVYLHPTDQLLSVQWQGYPALVMFTDLHELQRFASCFQLTNWEPVELETELDAFEIVSNETFVLIDPHSQQAKPIIADQLAASILKQFPSVSRFVD